MKFLNALYNNYYYDIWTNLFFTWGKQKRQLLNILLFSFILVKPYKKEKERFGYLVLMVLLLRKWLEKRSYWQSFCLRAVKISYSGKKKILHFRNNTLHLLLFWARGNTNPTTYREASHCLSEQWKSKALSNHQQPQKIAPSCTRCCCNTGTRKRLLNQIPHSSISIMQYWSALSWDFFKNFFLTIFAPKEVTGNYKTFNIMTFG